jgi:hypothetical protein
MKGQFLPQLKRRIKKPAKSETPKQGTSAPSQPSQKKSPQSRNTQATTPKPPTIMVQGRIPEITVKFTERIELPAEGKKVSIEVKGENDIRVRTMLNRKTLKKLD